MNNKENIWLIIMGYAIGIGDEEHAEILNTRSYEDAGTKIERNE